MRILLIIILLFPVSAFAVNTVVYDTAQQTLTNKKFADDTYFGDYYSFGYNTGTTGFEFKVQADKIFEHFKGTFNVDLWMDLDGQGSYTFTNLPAPSALGEAIRQTATITETNLNTLTNGSSADALHIHSLTKLTKQDQPSNPATDSSVIWMSTGVGLGDEGDVMIIADVSGTRKYATLFDYSGATAIDVILLETGDNILLETGDSILKE